jgi:UDP-N-acetylmuramate dehydrogenase
MTALLDALRAAFGDRVQVGEPLSPFTTFKLGGPADLLVTVDRPEQLRQAATLAWAASVPVTVIGGGSNLLIADRGVRGLVIRMRGGEVRQAGPGRVRADAGVTINGLVRWTIAHGLASLEAWAGTPGTVGGAIYGNAHFQGRDIGDLVEAVRLLDRDGRVQDVPASDLAFAYDYSRLQRTGEIVLSADFRVTAGDPGQLRAVARESLAYRKRTQPLAMPSAGCIFQNPAPDHDSLPPGMPWSAGALVDRAGLKGAREGEARVSPTHGNFIVNEGRASAGDVRRLIDRCTDGVYRKYGVRLREEIVSMGFERGVDTTMRVATSEGTED